MHYTVVIIVYLSVNVFPVISYSFNSENVILINQDSVKNTYFSYSLLLQAGENASSLIVGAPKNSNKLSSGGDVYKCDISPDGGTTCIQYPAGRMIDSSTPNGNFFGMTMDGDDHINGALVVCAPRTLPSNSQLNYLRGYCIYLRNSSDITQQPVRIVPLENAGSDSTCCDYGGKAYYNFGFGMAGFDVSFFSENDVLFGAPGVKKFNGVTISYSLRHSRLVSMLPYRSLPNPDDDDTYFGYSVATAKFSPNSEDVWFVAGAPRANNLKGKVTIYYYDVGAKEKINVVTSFDGDEMGSYFGASVLPLDVSNDGIVNMLVGAPMTKGRSWDEGCVYFYRGLHEKSFLRKIELTGSSKVGSRFGSAIVSLGDFDLDGYNDVAISAPYEDDGKGAVYIYKGSAEGLIDQFSQRLSPGDFNIGQTIVKGFGLGISKGQDTDGNGHNDIAIGAYKTDQVFIVRSYSIIDYQILLHPDISSIKNDTSQFNLRFCLLYTKRSDKDILKHVDFLVSLNMDYRALTGNVADRLTVKLGANQCKEYSVQLKETMMDISPFQIDLRLETITKDIIANGEKSIDVRIPYSHGCGDDNICNTDLSVGLESNRDTLVLGGDKQIDLKVLVNNNGEPAYQCVVMLVVPIGIELRNLKDCISTDTNYTCLISEKLVGFIEQDFIFDIRDITANTRNIEIRAEVGSLGINNPGSNQKSELTLPVVLDSFPYIVGKSVPDHIDLDIKKYKEDMEVVHQFSIGKNGPSPLEVNVDILIPAVEYDGEIISNIVDVVGKVGDIQISCTKSLIENKISLSDFDNLNIAVNRTVIVSCDSDTRCFKFSCKGEYLYSSDQLAVFKIETSINAKLLGLKYKNELTLKDLIAFVPVAYQRTSTTESERVGATAVFLVFVQRLVMVPLWVYLLAPILGVILLILIIYGLYMCHFFERIYKEKLEQEKILISDDASIEEEIFDNVVFRPMQENAMTEK
ncbi:unnamed protein product [Ceutorhynchus assimilis]|uniref:Integrin alpha second immunoglobulin-like domain-containing protein n=1 Tax=Ceutorhynchus assimilis TaxID=467358 RepID=A0A9N9MQG3_9CUCU|nr:unnamed protein product [Ceutorhynchus assimilis]